MSTDKFGQLIFDDSGIINLVMKGIDISTSNFLVEGISVTDIDSVNALTNSNTLSSYVNKDISVNEFDVRNQKNWHMPSEYHTLDIAEHILSLCTTQAELQRCGDELIMYQERKLFALLRYLHYLVNVMKENDIIWGVGRGSSVSSYVLYKLEVHKVDSMFYKLNIDEFLR